MFKWRFSLAVAGLAGILTCLFGIFQQTRLETLFFRTIVSVCIFSIAGFLIAILLNRFFRYLLDNCQTKGTQVDVTAGESLNTDAPHLSSEFTPLSPGNVKQVFRPKN
ncbi:MAG: hypothetical protein H6Q66_1031 [Firmicutes bacterium]|nr:hypothetical protein [Bacillota bacterium]